MATSFKSWAVAETCALTLSALAFAEVDNDAKYIGNGKLANGWDTKVSQSARAATGSILLPSIPRDVRHETREKENIRIFNI